MLKHIFPDYTYVSLEPLDIRSIAVEDPRGFLAQYGEKVIIDEAQLSPALFSYIQTLVDEKPLPGHFILSGSQNFLLLEQLSQSLAGRSAIFELLPLSYQELQSHPENFNYDVWELLYKGLYPRPYQENLETHIWYESYIRTYLERDVRKLLNVQDLTVFKTFLKLCAGRHGQILNLNALGNDCGISQTTASRWFSLLEASYILFRLQPHHANFKKRLVKSPKLYFYDSAIVAHLLGIESAAHLQNHAQRGAIFEGFVIAEWMKHRVNNAKSPNLYYWRDQQGHEIDLIYEKAGELFACEIKSSQTFNKTLLAGLKQWQKISELPASTCYLAYAGEQSVIFKDVNVKSWDSLVNDFPGE